MKRHIEIWDTTLREGEQTPGVIFSDYQKIDLVYKLKECGIDRVAIMAETSESDLEIVKKLANDPNAANIMSLARMKKESIDLTLGCGVQMIKLLVPVSDIQIETKFGITREANVEKALYYVSYCKKMGAKSICVAFEDSSRADINYLIEFAKSLSGKVDYIVFTDTIGDMIPSEVTDKIKKIKENFAGKLVVHFHNDRGLATANTIVAIAAGADAISGTFLGLGERTGNCALEEVIKDLKDKYENIEISFDTKKTREVCELVSKFSGISIHPQKAICGKNAFTHKAGIHFSAVVKNPKNYELFRPEEVGMSRTFIYGINSGISSLKYLFKDKYEDSKYKMMIKYLKDMSRKEQKDYSEFEVREIFKKINIF